MKRINFFMALFLFLGTNWANGATTEDSLNYYNALYEENINWDWTDPNAYPDYFYVAGYADPIPCVFPFSDPNLGVIIDKNDYQPEDGWVLLFKNFGSPDFPVHQPHMILYHKYTGIMRLYVFVLTVENYSRISPQTMFETNGSANLSFTISPSYALDRESEYIKFAQVGNCDGSNREWIYQDIPMAYDPDVQNKELVSFVFKIKGITVTNIMIDGEISLTTNKMANLGHKSKTIPEIIDGAGKSLHLKYTSWTHARNSTKSSFEQAADWFGEIGKTEIQEGLDELANAVSNLPFGTLGALYGLYTFFTGGGKQIDPIPYYTEGDIKLSGYMETEEHIGTLKMRIPASIPPENDFFKPVYNKPLGVVNISATPTVHALSYVQECNGSHPVFYSYKLTSDIDYIVNPFLDDLLLEEVESNLYSSFLYPHNRSYMTLDIMQDWADDNHISLTSGKKRKIENDQYEAILSYSTGNKTPSGLKGCFYNTPTNDVFLKLLFKFKNTENPEAEPIVLTPAFNVNIVNKDYEHDGPWSFYLKATTSGSNVSLKWTPFSEECSYSNLDIQESSDGLNWHTIYYQYYYNPSSTHDTYTHRPSASDGKKLYYRIRIKVDRLSDVYSEVKMVDNPNYHPLSVYISGPTSLENNEQGTFKANPSNGSLSYTDYRWWERNDEGGIEPLKGDNIIMAPPPNTWIELTSFRGRQQISIGRSYDFSLKCEVTDSEGDKATDIHSVNVGGGFAKAASKEGPSIAAVQIPDDFVLQNNYPNPFNPSTAIRFGLPQAANVTVTVYSLTGEKVKTLVNDSYPAGYHTVQWDGTNETGVKTAAGVYVYELKAGGKRLVKKMILTK